ncbi:hypothetical protein WICPIJ_007368, partial [Wickerhamomyces pijperi]
MRAAGKTSMSNVIAEQTGLKYVDLDEEFEKASGVTVKQFIQDNSWEEFRSKELEITKKYLVEHKEGYVISTGGGLVETPEARKLLQDYCKTG